jgi:hypothetical protein
MARNSGTVVAAAMWEGGMVTNCNYSPVITHTHPITLISVNGINQLHWAFW